MSVGRLLAVPQTVEINGKVATLHPLSIYSIALCEESWLSARRRTALESTIGLDRERNTALLKCKEDYESAHVDSTPLMMWIGGTIQGLVTGVRLSLDRSDISEHEVSRWIEAGGGYEEFEPLKKWRDDSGFGADFLDRVAVLQGLSLSHSDSTEFWTDVSSDGSTDSEASTEPKATPSQTPSGS